MKFFHFAVAAGVSLAALHSSPVAANPVATVSGDASKAVGAFVDAFNALDRARFDPLFADDVTLFFPSAPFAVRRVEGKEAVLGWFGRFFEAARGRGGKLNIQPADLHVQTYGDTAVATFHLLGAENLGRRTLVLARQAGSWKIVHLHASAQPEKKQPAN